MPATGGLGNVLSTMRLQFVDLIKSWSWTFFLILQTNFFGLYSSLSLRSLPVFSLLLGDILCATDAVSLLVSRTTNIYVLTRIPAAGGKFCSSVEQYT